MPKTESEVPHIRDFRPFLICNADNYEDTKSFYTELGFRKLWDDGGSACEFATGFGSQRFLVTLHHGLEPTQNAMLQFWVDDAQAWFDHLDRLQIEGRFPGVKVNPPTVTDWGWLITYVTDPSGILLHFAEPHSEENKTFFNNAEWIQKED